MASPVSNFFDLDVGQMMGEETEDLGFDLDSE